MFPDAESAWLALAARDARFDGRFFVGVTSTGVYCRPVCRVRTPRRENCRFFATAAQAEAAAFRPCLKCRPEIAPGLSAMDSSQALAAAAAGAIDAAVLAGEALSLAALAARIGVGERHLRRIFAAAHGVAPRDYLATQRLLLAKRLLHDTALPVAQVALASGFDSLRRFNAAFAERYRMAPTALRRTRGSAAPAALTVPLAYRPPYDIAALLAFAGRRALPGVEEVDGLSWRRTLVWPRRGAPALAGWIDCRFVPERHEVRVAAAPELAPVLGAVLRRVRDALDLDCDPQAIAAVLDGGTLAGTRTAASAAAAAAAPAPAAAPAAPAAAPATPAVPAAAAAAGPTPTSARRPGASTAAARRVDATAVLPPTLPAAALPPREGTRVPGAFDGFETAARVVLGQQVTVAAARTLAARIVARFGPPVATPFAALTHAFPDAATLAAVDAEALGALGIPRRRVQALQALAAAAADGRVALDRGAPLDATRAALLALPGIGEWTAETIAMRVLGWPDAWPAGDVALAAVLGTRDARETGDRAARWRPWRAYAAMRLFGLQETFR